MKFFKLKRARSLGGLLVGLGVLLTALMTSGGTALAMRVPADGGGSVMQPPPVAPAVGGMPGWQITLIAVGAALVAAVLAVVADRARSARGRLGAVPPQASGV
jgi:hypothetical protein